MSEYIGLPNYGNSCYVNVIMQLFLHNPKIWQTLYTKFPSPIVQGARQQYCETYKLRLYEQCDALFFLSFMLEKLPEFKDLWEQLWYNKSTCTECKHSTYSSQKENFWIVYPVETEYRYVIEGVEYDLDFTQCIAKQQKQLVDKKCDKCNKSTTHVKGFSLGNKPDILFFNMQLFKKKHTYICDGIELTVSNKLTANPIPLIREQQDYQLQAVIQHSGSLNGGHYLMYYLDSDGWTCYNDDTVFPIDDINSVLAEESSYRSFPLLVYTKIDTPIEA